MRIRSLYFAEGQFDRPHQPIDEFVAKLAGKVLIIFTVKVSDPNHSETHSQITSIAAVAVDANDGEVIDEFNEQVGLSLRTLREIDRQDRIVAAGEWPEGELSIRDMLNATDYDLEPYSGGETPDMPTEMDTVLSFRTWVDRYAGRAVLISYNATFTMRHLSAAMPAPIKSPIIDLSQFARIYFEPALRTMMVQGSKQAHDMAEKMWDQFKNTLNFTIHSMGQAFGVKPRKWHASSSAEEVYVTAGIFSKMLKFLQQHKEVEQKQYYRGLVDKAMEK